MSNTPTDDEFADAIKYLAEHVPVPDNRERTHFYGDGCDDEHGHDVPLVNVLGSDYVVVRRVDFDSLVAAVDHDHWGDVNWTNVVNTARRLIDNRPGRPADRDDPNDPGDDAWE